MKAARWYSIFCLSFVLWLLLFPPWVESRYAELNYPDFAIMHRLGHHWRFSVPSHWGWLEGAHQSVLVPDVGARIDYRTMLYETVLGIIILTLLFLLFGALEPSARRISAKAKLRLNGMGVRLRN